MTMKRRFVKSVLVVVACVPLFSIAAVIVVEPNPPIMGSGPLEWEWNIPTLQDETNFYTNVLGWTIPVTEPGFDGNFSDSYDWETPPAYGFGDIKDDTEGDDLWAWHHQQIRYGSSFTVRGSDTVGDWYDDVLDQFKTNLLTRLDTDENTSVYPHMYGQGLAAVYNATSDAGALTVLDGLRTRIINTDHYQDIITSPPTAVCTFGCRAVARQAIIAAYAAQATNDPAWITVRDNFVSAYETAPNWQDYTDTSIMAKGTGMYWWSESGMTSGNGFNTTPDDAATRQQAYDDGYRAQSTFMVGLVSEALWRLYIQTGNETLRLRLIAMARYVQHYAHDPAWSYPNVGSYFGHTDTGGRQHSLKIPSTRGDGTASLADTESSYDCSLVNTMVFGYKLTGEQRMLDFAYTLFSRCNRYHPGSTNLEFKAASQNHLLKYVDTTPNVDRDKFQWNKGVLQYAYQVFENGGYPSTVSYGGRLETEAANATPNSWVLISDSINGGSSAATLRGLAIYTGGGTDRSAFEYAYHVFWNTESKELHFRGGGASGGNPSPNKQRHFRYRDNTGDADGEWAAVTPWINQAGQPATHQWGHMAPDPRTGDIYFKENGSADIHKFTYQAYPWTSSDVTGTDSWPFWVTAPFSWGQTSAALGVHPDINDGKGGLVALVTATGDSRIRASGPDMQTGWTVLGTDVFSGTPAGGFETAMTYCPDKQWVLFGGGKHSGGSTDRIGKIEADGTVSRIDDVPFLWGANATGKVYCDDRIFAVHPDLNQLSEYDPDTNSWDATGLTQPSFTRFGGLANWSAGAYIREHGIIYLIVKGSGANDRLQEWIYKLP